MSHHNLIKKAIKKLKRQNISLLAEWDAGGDERWLNIHVRGKKFEFENLNISEALYHLIVDHLALPHAGEAYHKGSGVIDINSQGEVFIRFSASYTDEYDFSGIYPYHFFEDQDNWEEIVQEEYFTKKNIKRLAFMDGTLSISDPLKLHQLLHRARVTFMSRINDELQIQHKLFLHIAQGDDYPVSYKKLEPYHRIIEDILKKNLPPLRAQEQILLTQKNYTPFRSLIFEATLNTNIELEYILKPSEEKFINFHNKEVILIP